MRAEYRGLGTVLAILLTTSVANATAVSWQPTLDRAQAVAAQSNRLVLIHFWGDGCPPCARMESTVFSRADVAAGIDRGFVAVKVKREQSPNIARQYGIVAVPADVIITPRGQVLASHTGAVSAEEFLGQLGQVAQRYYAVANQSYAQQQQQQQPMASPAAPYGPNATPGYATPGVATGQPMPGQPMPGQPMPGQVAAGNAGYPSGTATGAMPASVTPPYSEQFGAGQNLAPPNQPNQPIAPSASPAARLGTQAAPNASPYGGGYGSGAAGQHSAATQAPTQAGGLPLALDGFCSVSLERAMRMDTEPKWTPGDPRWGVLHEGRTYLFAGSKEQQAFLGNPQHYAVVMSGYDVVARVDRGETVEGVREFGARCRCHNRIYLFSSQENYERFRANSEYYEAALERSQAMAADAARPSGAGAPAAQRHGYY